MKGARRILHLDLDPFLVSVERSLDPSLRDRPVVIGGSADSSTGLVAAASDEAQAKGVKPGQPLATARRLCPEAIFRPGDLEAYARVGDDVTHILLTASRRVERPSSDEAYLDLTPEGSTSPNPVLAAERVKDEIQRRLGLDVSLGLASSRLAARVASRCAKPRGFLVVLPGYETPFLARQPASFLAPEFESALCAAGFNTLGDIASGDLEALSRAVGAPLATHLKKEVLGEDEARIGTAAPPAFVLEEAPIRDRRSDRRALEAVLEGLVGRAFRRLRPHDLHAGSLSVQVETATGERRRTETVEPGIAEEALGLRIVQQLAEPLLEAPSKVRHLSVRLGRLLSPSAQAPLFPRREGAR